MKLNNNQIIEGAYLAGYESSTDFLSSKELIKEVTEFLIKEQLL